MGAMAVAAAEAVGYVSAGTVECLVDPQGAFFFLEMNTRIQVEHSVTELVTGVDLVRAQIEIAAGAPLELRQQDVAAARATPSSAGSTPRTPGAGFLPAPGRITRYREPGGPGVRVDSGIEEGGEVVGLYDPMIAKLLVWDSDRPRAIARMRRALDEFEIEGVPTLLPLHRLIFAHPAFQAGETCAGLVEGELAAAARARRPGGGVPAGADRAHDRRRARRAAPRGAGARAARRAPSQTNDGAARSAAPAAATGGAGGDSIASPMQGTVLRVEVSEGEAVEPGQGARHSRSDEDGERDRRRPAAASCRTCASPPATRCVRDRCCCPWSTAREPPPAPCGARRARPSRRTSASAHAASEMVVQLRGGRRRRPRAALRAARCATGT